LTTRDGHNLKSPRFAGDPVLEACYDKERYLRKGDRGSAVQKIQQALIDAGFPLPRFGADGDFGNETDSAVIKYQQVNGLAADGIVGSNTIKNLDDRFAAESDTCKSDATFNTTWTRIKNQIVKTANQEYTFWTRPDRSRYKETDAYVTSKLQGYWSATGRSVTVTQCQDPGWQKQHPWSASFISWVMSQAGARNSFKCSALHMEYVYAAKQNTVKKDYDNPFWLCNITNSLPEPGDLICRNRGSSNYTYDTVQPSGSSHCDVVVEVNSKNKKMFVIGGNKTDTVDREDIRLTGNGLVDTGYGDQKKIFAVLKLRKDKCKTCL